MKVALPAAPQNSMKIKALVRSPVLRHLFHALRLLTRAKSLLLELVNYKNAKSTQSYDVDNHKRIKKSGSLYGSIRLHYNWCSSHVRPMPDPVAGVGYSGSVHDGGAYYDATWNSVVVPVDDDQDGGDDYCDSGPPLTGELPHWLREESGQYNPAGDGDVDEINRLADVFIANCHEKFRLEKQESYRLFQEMLARGL